MFAAMRLPVPQRAARNRVLRELREVMNKAERQMQELGVAVHGALTVLHLLGVVYNTKKHNWLDVAAHTAAATYDTFAVIKHIRALEE